MVHLLWQALFHIIYMSNSITFPFSDVSSVFKDNEFSIGWYTCQHVCLREVRRLKIVGRTWHIRNKGAPNYKKNNKINQAHMLSSCTDFLFIYVHHSSHSQTRLYHHQPTQLHHPATFLPVSGRFMALITLQMFSLTVGKSQYSYALWDMTYDTT